MPMFPETRDGSVFTMFQARSTQRAARREQIGKKSRHNQEPNDHYSQEYCCHGIAVSAFGLNLHGSIYIKRVKIA